MVLALFVLVAALRVGLVLGELRNELGLSGVVAAVHGSTLGVGLLLMGAVGARLVDRVGRVVAFSSTCTAAALTDVWDLGIMMSRRSRSRLTRLAGTWTSALDYGAVAIGLALVRLGPGLSVHVLGLVIAGLGTGPIYPLAADQPMRCSIPPQRWTRSQPAEWCKTSIQRARSRDSAPPHRGTAP